MSRLTQEECQSCETKPISRLRIADCRNGTGQLASAFGGVVGLRIGDRLPPGAADCAKRTQFAAMGKDRWGKPHPTGGLYCAKQTQFGPPLRRGRLVRNEPNSRPRRAGRGPGAWDEAQMCKTKPISSTGTRQTCKTNPICPAAPDGAPSPLHPPAPPPPSRLCKTNPISGPAGRDEATGGAGRGAIVQNEPNLARPEQSRASTGEGCKTNPISGGAGRDEGCCTNKPNSCHPADPEIGVPGRANRAKRTQFARWGRAGRGPGGGGRGANAQNEPNLARAGPGRDGRKTQNEPNFRPVGPDPEGRLCKTKPICPPRPGGLPSPLPNRLCKTKPNLGRMGYLGGASGRHIVRNEANLSPGRCRAGACPEFVEGTPNPRSGRGQAPRGAEVSVGAPAPSMHEPAFGYNGRHWRNKGASERRWPWLLRRKS